jgi:hypothetical protein
VVVFTPSVVFKALYERRMFLLHLMIIKVAFFSFLSILPHEYTVAKPECRYTKIMQY